MNEKLQWNYRALHWNYSLRACGAELHWSYEAELAFGPPLTCPRHWNYSLRRACGAELHWSYEAVVERELAFGPPLTCPRHWNYSLMRACGAELHWSYEAVVERESAFGPSLTCPRTTWARARGGRGGMALQTFQTGFEDSHWNYGAELHCSYGAVVEWELADP
jgi:hypothetical protein